MTNSSSLNELRDFEVDLSAGCAHEGDRRTQKGSYQDDARRYAKFREI